MDIQDIIKRAESGENVTGELRAKSITVPPWYDLEKEYNPTKHPVMNKAEYPDITIYEERVSESEKDEFGQPKVIKVATGVEKVSRVTYALQDLAVKRTAELCFGIPVERVYKPQNDRQKEIAKYMERIYQRNHIDTVNIERGRMLFASCEIMTLWYGVEEKTDAYGFKANIKLRNVTYSRCSATCSIRSLTKWATSLPFPSSMSARWKIRKLRSSTHIRQGNTFAGATEGKAVITR